MPNARSYKRYSASIKQEAVRLRQDGKTHREIAKLLHASLGIVCDWTKRVRVTPEQKIDIERRRNKRTWSKDERAELSKRMAAFHTKYTAEDLLQKIRRFYQIHGRIPLKREFNAWDIYTARFGSWNKAIVLAGFEPNPVLFAKKFTAQDGHACDSFTEKIIDDWLFAHGVEHVRHQSYGRTRLTADFSLAHNVLVEFFGLAGVQAEYDRIIARKRRLAKKLGYRLIEIYPDMVYPVSKLDTLNSLLQ